MDLKTNDPYLNIFWKLLKYFFYDEKFTDKLNENELKILFNIAEIHNLNPALFHVLKENKSLLKIADTVLYKKQKKEYRYAMYYATQLDEYIDEINRAFSDKHLKILFFKGAQLRNYYPISFLRTMGDLDCLIFENDRKTADKIMCQLKYNSANKNLDVWEYNKGNIHIEMQSKLSHNGVGNGFDYTQYFSDAFNHTKTGYNSLQLENEYNLCYLFYHIAKHLSSTGVGIRMVLDIAFFTKAVLSEIDLKKLKLMLNETQLIRTANAIYGLCDKWFDTSFIEKLQLSAEIPDGLEEYIINGGTFGFETHNIGDIYRRKAFENLDNNDCHMNRLKAIKNFFFPPIEYMQQYVFSVKKHPWLLPIAWIKRFFIGLLKRNKHSLNTLNSINSGDNEQSFKEAQMLRKMGL